MKRILFLLSACLIGSAGSAAEVKRTYGGIEFSTVRIANETQKIANDFTATLGGSVNVSQDSSTWLGRVFLGHRLNEKWSIEGGVFSTGKFDANVSGRSGGGLPYTAKTRVDIQGFEVAAVWNPTATRIGEEGFFLKAGLHSSKISADSSITVSTTRSSLKEDNSGVGSLFGVGYDWKLGADWFFRSSVTRYLNLGGESGSKATAYSIGFGTSF